MTKERRKLFKVRLEHLIDLTKEVRWNEVYELLFTRARERIDKKKFVTQNETRGKEDYILVGFIPKYAEQLDRSIWGTDVWIVSGCGQSRKDGKVFELEAVIEAVQEFNEWYFSGIALKLQLDSVPQKCNSKAEGSQ